MDARPLRLLRLLRLLLLCLLVLWFLAPPQWRYAVPLWLPFGAALMLELQFFVGGLRKGRRSDGLTKSVRSRGPQRRDIDEFGWGGNEPPEEEDPAFWQSQPVPRRRGERTLLRRLVEPAIVFAAIALAVWAIGAGRGWSSLDNRTQAKFERVLSRAAQLIAQHSARVRCDSSGRQVGFVQEADGRAEVGGHDAWLTPATCYRLYRLVEKHDASSFSGTGRAIVVLAHESWHLRGVRDEAVANCYAFQSGVELGVRFGLAPATAEAMMREQLADNAIDSSGDNRYLVPSGCTNGGRYDLNRRVQRFP
jgi:hypothetical protein